MTSPHTNAGEYIQYILPVTPHILPAVQYQCIYHLWAYIPGCVAVNTHRRLSQHGFMQGQR